METVVKGITRDELSFDCERARLMYSRRLYCGGQVRKGEKRCR
jgi:hypothetical protein